MCVRTFHPTSGYPRRHADAPMTPRYRLALAFAVLLGACSPSPSPSPSLGPDPSGPIPSTSPISPDAVRTHLEALEAIADANGGVRTVGTAGYEASVQYVAQELRDLGYAVETPEFEIACDRVGNVNARQVAAFADAAVALSLAIATGQLPIP